MTDALSKPQFLHASDHPFSPGDTITPSGVPEDRWDPPTHPPTHVYATTKHETARFYAGKKQGGKVYSVEPLADDLEPTGSVAFASRTGFRVKGEVNG